MSPRVRSAICLLLSAHTGLVCATGVQPESTVIFISESDGIAQMAVRNTEDIPMLLNVEVIELTGDSTIGIFAMPSVARIEPGGNQLVRFSMQKPAVPLSVQHMKRVAFEGIPGLDTRHSSFANSQVRINVRQIIPVIISPAALEQDIEPWKRLTASIAGPRFIEISNPSPFVVRLQSGLSGGPGTGIRISDLQDTYILPSQKIRVAYRKDDPLQAFSSITINPASPWGYMAAPYDIPVSVSQP